ncbi:hypothetical protein COOONC_18603, partial [Cooperia oncophora]
LAVVIDSPFRYSVLDQHLPLKVTTTPSSPDHEDDGPQFMYLEAPPTDCYCDESCTVLGDCCSDYTYEETVECQNGLNGSHVYRMKVAVARCRAGRVDPPARGGKECPALKEMRTCFKQCAQRRSLDDITTVALLIDYRYNDTRSKMARDNIYWDIPSVREKLQKATYYCVKYRIGWVNRNCWHKQIKTRLY